MSPTRSSATSRSRGRPASFISAYVKGGDAYAKGKAKTISGRRDQRRHRQDHRDLVAPFAPIVDIFALPGTAPVPPSTPMKNLASTGTIGDGPYMWGPISPGHPYTVVKNPKFDVPGLPKGHAAKIVYNVNSNVLANAQAVLNNQADVFDPGDTLPASILQQVKTSAADRYQAVPLNSSWYFWFGVTRSRSTTCTRARRCWPRWTTGRFEARQRLPGPTAT